MWWKVLSIFLMNWILFSLYSYTFFNYYNRLAFSRYSKKNSISGRCEIDKNESKMFSEENDMIPGNPPDWTQDLTQIEEMLCSPILCMMSIFTLKGSQYGYSGNIINFP